jgi:penicillin-binding protein 1A
VAKAKTPSKTLHKPPMPKGFKTYARIFWALFFLGVIGFFSLFYLASIGVFGDMPTFDRLENPQTNQATQIISADGKVLGTFYLEENRNPVTFEELPENLVQALLATEDVRFYDHSGIDAIGTLRAVAYLGTRGGASTITQQLSKLLFTKRASSNKFARLLQKVKEWVIATRLERQYTKNEIMAMYLNIYDFGNNADGIRSAANIYFGKEPMELDPKESAMLVGMLKNSSLYNPIPSRNPEGTRNRRNAVLAQMEKYDFLDTATKDSLQSRPLDLNFSPQTHRDGKATYFRMYLQGFLKQWIAENPKEDGSKYNLYLDGLKVYTTIDSRMQANAENAVKEHMKNLQAAFFKQNTQKKNPSTPFRDIEPEQEEAIIERAIKTSERRRQMREKGFTEAQIAASFKVKRAMQVFDWNSPNQQKDTLMSPLDSIRYYKSFLRAAMMSMEPQTGHVRAWVGGVNYRHFQYDHVIQGTRQAGSIFKPFVYATAIDQLRLSPCETLPDTQFCIAAGKHGNMERWCPKNSGGTYTGEMLTYKRALARSVNSVTAQVIDKVGPNPVVQLVKNLGIKSKLLPVPSIALGTADVNVYEMVGAYGTFANKGVYVKPVMVTAITDKAGTLLYEYVPETKDVMSQDVAYTVTNLLEGVTKDGSGIRLRTEGAEESRTEYKEIVTGYPWAFKNPIAGKTGTTQNQSDGWFMGMVPNLVSVVWVGGEERATHFETITYGQGASMALPIWANYMRDNYAIPELGISMEAFERPENLSIVVDCEPVLTEEGDPGIDLAEDDLEGLDF